MATIDPDLIKWYRCQTWEEGSTHGGDIDLNSEITTATDKNVFDDVEDAERQAGDTEYRKIYIRNENAETWPGVKLWIKTNTPAANDSIAIALAVTNDDTQQDAEGYTFYTPTSKDDADVLDIGDLAQNEYKGIWIKRVVSPADGDGYINNYFELQAENS